ncbi:cation diffusion facilitator 1 [Penicillium brasilianum]|uniref:Cation diffusion facilitator 1 n=1 Tax=Penicillium brasilianum TaxID=104259 RepID=A0A1S9RYD9_PENBI|nr:cation diffusion facilitator 1 [Penicillium brasilianum]
MEDHIRHSISNHPTPFQHLSSSSPHPSYRSERMTPRSFGEATSTGVETEDPTMSQQQHRHTNADEEGQLPPRYTPETDPFHLASKLKTEEEIRQIKANTGRKRDATTNGPRVIEVVRDTGAKGKQALITRKLQGFYETQNENIERMLKPVEEHVRAARELNSENSLKYKIAVYASFAANIILCVVQVYGAASSGSLSLFTTMADAIFDPMSNLTLLLCNKAVNRVDPRKFPAGKARVETAGNICFCFLMTAVSFIIIAFSIRELVAGSDTLRAPFHLPSIIAVAVAFVTKLGLFLYCFALRNQVSQIRILWEDHRNDLLINGFGLLTSVLGSKIRWWIDPMGAILLSMLVSGLWLHSAYGEFQLLVGVTADNKMQQLITYISMTHSPLITAIDTVRAYTSGPRLLVEVDIVMEDSASLRATHDVAEELQMKLESLPDVERAYVHVDYETTHKPEHFLKKEL